MDENTQTDEAECLRDRRRREDGLLEMLTETIRGLEAVRRRGDHHIIGTVGGRRRAEREEREQRRSQGGTLGTAEDRKEEDEGTGRGGGGREQKVLGALRELSVFHSGRVTAWREALREQAHMLDEPPPGGGDRQHPFTADTRSNSFRDTWRSVGEEIQSVVDKLNAITMKLDEEILRSRAAEEEEDSTPQETREPQDDLLEFQPGLQQDVGQNQMMPSADTEQTSGSRFCNGVEEEELAVNGRGGDNEGRVSPGSRTDLPEETNENDKNKEEANKEWITVGLTGRQDDGPPDVPDACFVRAPAGVAELLRCEVADALSCLMVTGSEELVSRVIRVRVRDGVDGVHFPVTVAVPFCTRYRGNYRDVAVKVVDGERRASYITPVTTEGAYGGQRGSFAEVRVYSLGLFAVVSCLKRENYTVPTKGLSLKLTMDPRICLNYLPGSFTAPVMAQTTIQPVDAAVLAAVKSRGDSYRSVVSTSPLLYLAHPSSQPLRRPLTLTLPCPPNPEKKRPAAEEGDDQTGPAGASLPWGQASSQRRRFLGVSVKSKEASDELLVVLGSRDKQWSILDKVTVRNQPNRLVSFELTENFDRLLVARLLSPLQPCRLASLAAELEESVCRHAVTVVLQCRRGEPHVVLVAALPSRDLGWELSKLRARGYAGLPEETSAEISMCEGDQLLLRFSGNITSTGTPSDRCDVPRDRITFHSQQKNHLLVQLTEVDPFGNYSSPHYKGTAVFYKVSRGRAERRGDERVSTDAKLLGDPVCKLSLTLPKKARAVNRPVMARVKLCEETDSLPDSLLLWLSGELSEEELDLLIPSLRLRRSAAQLVKLRAGDSLPAQAFHVLAMWRRGLPTITNQPKASQLAHCLAKSGRPDLARELLLRQAATATTGPGSIRQGGLKSRKHTAF